jgi:DNA-directed RNA polymerase sigma subunit (sigma70/sigma32)
MRTNASTAPGSPEERNALVLRWRFLPRKLVREMLRRRPDRQHVLRAVGFDDLEQAGLLCLVLAASRWDRGRGVRFSTFAFPYVLNGIRKEILRRLGRRPPVEPLAREPAAPADGPRFEELGVALARLVPADRVVLEQYFGLGGRRPRTFDSIARACGRTKECIRKRLAKAMTRLSAELAALR